MNFLWMNEFVFWVTVSVIVTRTSYSTEIACLCLFFLFLNPIEKKWLDVTLGRHGMLSRQHIFIEEFFFLLKKTFPHNWISILDVEMAFLTLKRKLKLKIKLKNYFLEVNPKAFYLIQMQCCSIRKTIFLKFCFFFQFFFSFDYIPSSLKMLGFEPTIAKLWALCLNHKTSTKKSS